MYYYFNDEHGTRHTIRVLETANKLCREIANRTKKPVWCYDSLGGLSRIDPDN